MINDGYGSAPLKVNYEFKTQIEDSEMEESGAKDSLVEFAHCVHCGYITINPKNDRCECGQEFYPFTKFFKPGQRIFSLSDLKGL